MFIGLLLIGLLIIPISFASDADIYSADHSSEVDVCSAAFSSDSISVGDDNFNLESNAIPKDSKNPLKSIEDDRLIGNRTFDGFTGSSDSDGFTGSSDSDDFAGSFDSAISSDYSSDSEVSNDLSNEDDSVSQIRSITNSLNDFNTKIKGLNYSEYEDYINLNNQLLSYDFNLTAGNTIYVNASYEGQYELGTKANPFKTINKAYTDAFRLSSNTKFNMFLAEGTYTLSGRMSITKNLNLIGENLLNTIIDCNDYEAFYITPPSSYNSVSPLVNIVNLTFTKGNSWYGGAFYINQSAVNFVNTIFKNNKAVERAYIGSTYPASGGAIYNDKGFVRIYNSIFENNTANGSYDSYAGAVFNDMGEITILGSQFINNKVIGNYSSGGAIYDYSGILVIFNSTISNNTLISNYSMGGGLATWASHNVFIINSTFDSNEIYGKYTFGSAISNKANLLAIDNTTISNNLANGTSDENGTFFNLNGILNFTNVTFTSNRVTNTKEDLLLCLEDQLIVAKAFDDELLFDLPSSYDLRDLNLVTPVKDQGGSGSCWAFSTLAAIESYLLKTEGIAYDFSENHMKNLMGYYGLNGTDWADGGNHYMSLAYLLRWSGPVDERLDPFDDSSHSSVANLNISKKVQDVLYIPVRLNYLDTNQIKKALMTYGALYTTINADNTFQYNPDYYLDVISVSNHAITLVGWDDNYSANNFAVKPPGDGAFIIKNSWNTDYGYEGYWYISYYDKSFAGFGLDSLSAMAITNVENVSAYKNIYQYDILGNTFESLGFNSNTAWMANQFTAQNNNPLAAFGLYTFGSSSYLVNITVNGVSKLIQEGNVSGAGYHTIKLDNYVELAKNDIFKIIVKLTTPDSYYPIAIETQRSGYSSGAVSGSNQSFISFDGETWQDIYEDNYALKFYQYLYPYGMEEANVCLKAYTIGVSDMSLNVKSNASIYTKGDLVELKVYISNEGETVNDLNISMGMDSLISIESVNYIKGSFDSSSKVWHLNSLAEGETEIIKFILKMNLNKEVVNFTVDYNFSGYIPSDLNTSQVLSIYYEGVSKFVEMENVSTLARSNEQAIIQLVNLESEGLSDKEVIISLVESDNGYLFENQTLFTGVDGKASFVLDLLEGNYVFLASFAGDDVYKSSNMTFNVSVSRIDTLIDLNGDASNNSNLSTLAKSNDIVNFTLSDGLSNISDKEILISLVDSDNGFVFENQTLITGVDGKASFVLDLLEGNYVFLASFAGDDQYKSSNILFNVSVSRINSFIALNGDAGNDMNLSSFVKSNDLVDFTLSDGLRYISDKEILISLVDSDNGFVFENQTLITGVDGKASFVLDLLEGNYVFLASFAGDDLYNASDLTFNLNISRRSSSIELDSSSLIISNASDLIGLSRSNDTISFTLYDQDLNPLANKTIILTINELGDGLSSPLHSSKFINNMVSLSQTISNQDSFQTGNSLSQSVYDLTTDSNGVATFDLDLTKSIYEFILDYYGDELYAGSQLRFNISIVKRNAPHIIADETEIDASNPYRVHILDDDFSPIVNQFVLFLVTSEDGQESFNYSAMTDENGVAALDGLSDLDSGNYTLTISLESNDLYEDSNLQTNICLINEKEKVPTMFRLIGDWNIFANDDKELQFELLDESFNPLANKTIYLYINSDDVMGSITDSNGIANVTVNLDEGDYEFNLKFLCDDEYVQSNFLLGISVSKRNSKLISGDTLINISDENSQYDVYLVDDKFNPIVDETVLLILSSQDNKTLLNYYERTDEKGTVSLIGLNSFEEGSYLVKVVFNSNSQFNGDNLTKFIVLIKDLPINDTDNDTNGTSPGSNGTSPGSNGTSPGSNGTENATEKINTLFKIDVSDLNIFANLDNELQFALLDESLNPLADKTIYLTNSNLNKVLELVTDSNGIVNSKINLDEGNYGFALNYLGDDEYSQSSLLFNLTVSKRNSKLISGDALINISSEDSQYDVYLVDDKFNPIANEIVSFVLSSDKETLFNISVKTNDEGIASLSGLSGLEEGNYMVNAIFNSNSIFNGTDLNKTITLIKDNPINGTDNGTDNGTNNGSENIAHVRKATKIIYNDMVTQSVIPEIDGRIGDYFYVTLVDEDNNPLVNKDVKIGFNGKIYNRTTNETGGVRLQINLKNPVIYTFAICFLGDDDYNASFEVAKITVNKKKMSLAVPNKSYKSSAKSKTLTATLKDSRNNLVANKKVTFTVNGKTYTATTNSKGVASVKVSLSSKKTYSFSVKFAGDSYYGAVTKSAKVSIK